MGLFSKTHKCEFEITQASGDKYAKFYINRICKICGKAYHKDLRYGTEYGWQLGEYRPEVYSWLRSRTTTIKPTARKYNKD